MNQIESSFTRLGGERCWGVKRGYGSFLTLEFGSAHLVIREPRAPDGDVSRSIRELFARRLVRARGRWHLWIYCCDWRVSSNGAVVGDSTSARRIDRAARGLTARNCSMSSSRRVARGLASYSISERSSKRGRSIAQGSNGCCMSLTATSYLGAPTGNIDTAPALVRRIQ